MKTYFIFSFLFSIVITQSCNTGDRQIQQRCFNLVNQQLSWSEARNYCHNRNSYLATVPEQTTDSYLASYARTSFNINEGNFWIGLYRNSTTSKWQWDDGTPFAWNNFENPNLNYVAESIKNGKWNTFVAETRLNFVCSYYPNGAPTEPVTGSTEPPHWTTTESETVTPTDDPPCTPTSPRTVFLAYSTDFEPSLFLQNFDDLYRYQSDNTRRLVVLTNVRFDLEQPEDIEIHYDMSSWNSSVYAHPPNSSLGYKNTQTGSDILKVLDKFLDNKKVSLCGALIWIALKRYPNEQDIDSLVMKVRQHHSAVRVIIYTNSSGGLYPETMYRLATKTNGLGYFSSTEWQGLGTISDSDYEPNLIYAVNVNVSGNGSVTLPSVYLPTNFFYNLDYTFQDSGILSSFQSINLTFTGQYYTYPIIDDQTYIYPYGNYLFTQQSMYLGNYSVTLQYSYNDTVTQTLQIRLSSVNDIDFWIPYAD